MQKCACAIVIRQLRPRLRLSRTTASLSVLTNRSGLLRPVRPLFSIAAMRSWAVAGSLKASRQEQEADRRKARRQTAGIRNYLLGCRLLLPPAPTACLLAIL